MQNSESPGFFVGVTKLIKFIPKIIPYPLYGNSKLNGGPAIPLSFAPKKLPPVQTTVPAIQMPLKQESSTSEVTTDDAEEAQQFQEFLRFKAFQKQMKQQAPSATSPTSSQDSSTDPFGGPCAQGPFEI
ncbi:hypothetical protein M9H77_32666 [Catharanthus roseus]|uniref:Uncharacterized protein n=1 Tax=Catharanthus roseus TaxID=4058 RepID=A0ACC0A3V6_CATRO|nr:hypothetical protein M9H77_32666 [Catharanthus roseus]